MKIILKILYWAKIILKFYIEGLKNYIENQYKVNIKFYVEINIKIFILKTLIKNYISINISKKNYIESNI